MFKFFLIKKIKAIEENVTNERPGGIDISKKEIMGKLFE
jgi:hypothetical protein